MKILIPITKKEIAKEAAKDLVVLDAPEEYKEKLRMDVLLAKKVLEEKAIEIKMLYKFIKENEHLL